jgi:hypothetical protein
MKTNILKSVFFVALAIGTLSSCVNDDSYDVPVLDCTQPNLTANRTIPQVISASAPLVAQYTYDDVIAAYVVSSDEAGNFYKSISLQTLATATTPAVGFSVPVDAANTYVDYRPGVKVYIKMKDLYTDIIYGSMRIGGIYVNSSSVASVGRLPQTVYKVKLIASCSNVSEEVLVKQVTVSQLLNDANLNTLCEVSGVQFTDAAVGRHYYESANDLGGATNWNLTDVSGNQVIFRTSAYATYASKLVPTGSGKVRGVLTKYGSDYQFMARSEADVMLTGARSTPFFSEDFQSAVNSTTLNIPNWTNVATVGTKLWQEKTFSGNGYAELSSFGSTNAVNESWLVSPAIDMNSHTGEVLIFKVAQHHLDVDSPLNSLKVYVSTNFTGNVTTATWTQVTVALPTQATPWYQFVSSGGIDLSSYTGNINVAFKFTGSGTNLTLDGAFQVDDFKVFGN